MKKIFGFIILLIALVVFAGCTQQAAPVPVTTPPTTIPTLVQTTEITPVPTLLPTTVVTTVVTTALPTPTRTLSPQSKLLTTIHMKDNAFVPPELIALPGSGITWINDDSTAHSLKATAAADSMFNSGDILPGSQWSYAFGKKEGTFNISCIYHPDMKGTVVIKTTSSVVGNPQK